MNFNSRHLDRVVYMGLVISYSPDMDRYDVGFKFMINS